MKLTGPHGGGKSYIFFFQIFILSEREEHKGRDMAVWLADINGGVWDV